MHCQILEGLPAIMAQSFVSHFFKCSELKGFDFCHKIMSMTRTLAQPAPKLHSSVAGSLCTGIKGWDRVF